MLYKVHSTWVVTERKPGLTSLFQTSRYRLTEIGIIFYTFNFRSCIDHAPKKVCLVFDRTVISGGPGRLLNIFVGCFRSQDLIFDKWQNGGIRYSAGSRSHSRQESLIESFNLDTHATYCPVSFYTHSIAHLPISPDTAADIDMRYWDHTFQTISPPVV